MKKQGIWYIIPPVKLLLFKYRYILILAGVVTIFATVYRALLPDKFSPGPSDAVLALSDEDRAWIDANPVVTVGVDLDFAPIEDMDNTGNYIGVTADFLALVTRKTGLEFRIDHGYTWAESLERIKQGKIHMLGAAVASDQRKAYMDFTAPYAWLSGVIIVPKTVTEPMSLEKLKGMNVTVVNDYIWKDFIETHYPDMVINPAQDIRAALKKVSFGMADAMVGYMATASHHIERLGISNLKISGETVSVLDISFAVSKQHPRLTRILNQVLSQTTEDQKKAMVRKWIRLEFTKPDYIKWVTRIIFPGVALVVLGLIATIIWNRSLQRQVQHRTEKLNQELVQRSLVEQALRESEEKYKSIFRNIQDVYYELLPQGRIIEISPSVQKVFGYNRDALLKDSMAVMFDNPGEFVRMLETASREHRLDDYGAVLVCPDGNRLNCSINAVMIRDNRGTPSKIVGSIHNITERVKAQRALKSAYKELEKRVRERTAELRNTNRELNKAKEAADAATRAKSNFLANMSHEIRTPLSGVISASELVMHEDPPKKIARYINIIRSSGHALLGVIDDILDFSKIEAGKLDIEIHTFKLDQLITRSANLFKQKIKDKDISFEVDVTEDTPTHLKGDSFRIQQILTNLLGNAVKFTDKGGTICLKITGQPCAHKPDRVFMEFEVSDTGIGISPKHQDLLFTPFSQIDASTTRKYGGSGLGLSICGQLVEIMEGTITVESAPNKGSRFIFTIPLERWETAEEEPDLSGPGGTESLSEFKTALQGKRILVAEDTPTNQEIILAVLDLAGIETALADTGAKAVDAVNTGKFHAVLMDLQMPEMDGFEATRIIRRTKTKESLPVIAMTAHTLKEDEAKCMAAGMNAYISKPVNQDRLFRVLIRLIHATDENPSRPVKTENPNSPPAGSSPRLPGQVPGIEIGQAIQALGVAPEVFLKILNTFFINYEDAVTEIETAWEAGDMDRVTTLAHSLKGSASGIGALEVQRRAEKLEQYCKTAPDVPQIDASELDELEHALTIVLAAIKSLVPEEKKQAAAGGGVTVQNPAAALKLLDQLDRSLAFPELRELETLGADLAAVCTHPKLTEILNHIAAHDHDLARQHIGELHAALKRMAQ